MSASAASAARRAAFEVLRRVFEQDAWADRAFRSIAEREGLAGRDRAFAQRLSYGAVQRRGTADHLVGLLAERPTSQIDPPALAALRLGLYELLFAAAVPDYAAVSQAVELVKQAGAGRAAGLVNAVLRRAGRERPKLLAGLDDRDPAAAAVMHSVPGWLSELWWSELGADGARSLLAACNEPAELAMRVNTLRAEPMKVIDQLQSAGVNARRAESPAPLGPAEMLVIDGPMGDATVERIQAGVLTPQSRGSAAVVELLDPQPGERVLDLCAGPGTKTGAIAARMEDRGELVGVEVNRRRCEEIRESMQRLGVTCAEAVEADAATDPVNGVYDRVLLDAPCSDLGALASRPDARWRKDLRLIERLAELQARILSRAAAAVRPGGTLVYATCTICRTENESQVASLLDSARRGDTPEVEVEDLGARFGALGSSQDPRCLQIRPDRDRTTGFFICRLNRHD